MSSFLMKAGLGFLLAVSLLVAPVGARAQGIGEAPQESVPGSPSHETRTFGTPSVSHTLQAFAFTGSTFADSATSQMNSFGSRFCSAARFCEFGAAVLLPAGALVTRIELDACDTNPAGRLTAGFNQTGALESSSSTLFQAITGFPETPGCAFFSSSDLASPVTIDNDNNTYRVQVFIQNLPNSGSLDSTTRFQAVRIFYNLQVSPAPAAATFNDVPTSHPFFRFIEALADAGITAGCSVSPPLYCPDDPLTRGQMAVFLGRALGLQFAP